MFVRSTGLGRTLLTGRIARIVATNVVPSTLEPPTNGTKEPMRLLMEMEITNPVHWTVRAFVDPPDLREMIKHVIKNPGLIFNGIKFLFMKGPKYDVPGAHGEAPKAATSGPGPAAAPKGGPPAPPKGPSPIPTRT
jgi:hypothetical protein